MNPKWLSWKGGGQVLSKDLSWSPFWSHKEHIGLWICQVLCQSLVVGICGLKGPVNFFNMHLKLIEGIIRTTTSWSETWGHLVMFKLADLSWISCLQFVENLAHLPFLSKLRMCLEENAEGVEEWCGRNGPGREGNTVPSFLAVDKVQLDRKSCTHKKCHTLREGMFPQKDLICCFHCTHTWRGTEGGIGWHASHTHGEGLREALVGMPHTHMERD